MNHQLDSRLRHLRLSGMAASLSHREFLELLVEDELNTRRDRLLARRIKQAGFPALKTLEDFDWGFNTSINKRQLSSTWPPPAS
jgi:DNA replication protein DnaC